MVRQTSDMAGFAPSVITPEYLSRVDCGQLSSLTSSYSAYSQIVNWNFPRDTTGFWFSGYCHAGTSNVIQIAMALGPSAENELFTDYYIAGTGFGGRGHSTFFPLAVPGSSRLSWKAKSATSCNIIGTILPVIAGNPTVRSLESYSASQAQVGSGTSSWTQIVAATQRRATWLVYGCGGSSTNYDGYCDIGIGTAGSEQVLISGLEWDGRGGGSNPVGKMGGGFQVDIPSGSRVSFRNVFGANSTGTAYMSIHLGAPT